MKKFLTIIFAVAIVFSGLFVFNGCDKVKDFSGYYKLYYQVELSETEKPGNFADELNYEIYVKVESEVVKEYVFVYSASNVSKNLIKYNSYVLNKDKNFFETFEESGTTFYKEYTNLTGSTSNNPNLINYKLYTKVDAIPTISENSLQKKFGTYKNGETNNTITVDNTITQKNGAVETKYEFDSYNTSGTTYYVYKSSTGATLNFAINGTTLTVYNDLSNITNTTIYNKL